jgi:hypothetical protein
MGLFDAVHGLGRLIVIVVSVPLLLVGLTFAGAAIADDGGAVLGGSTSGDAQMDDLVVGVGIGGILLLIGGTGLYRGVTGNLTGSGSRRSSDGLLSGDPDAVEDAMEAAIEGGFDGDGDGGGFGGFDGDGGGAGGDGGGGGGGGGE